MELHQYKNLLDQVNAINSRYKKIDELTGDNFNVFRILKLESSEVRMHSAFIAELLNPKGSHGQKDVFLKLFIQVFCFKGNCIDTISCKVKVEENIGIISDDRKRGGRIDITVTDKNFNRIIIENKIHAGDQENQLVRYYDFSHNADLIYLTLDGKAPNEISKRELENDKHFKCFSYEHHILNWLELCRKEVAIYPTVREGLTHYINLIKYLTNQTINENMQEELSDLLKSNIEAAFEISNNLDAARVKISNDFAKVLIKECEDLDLVCEYDLDFISRYNGIWIYKKGWKRLSIGFQFQNYDKEMRYGIVTDDPQKLLAPEVIEKFKSLPNNSIKINVWWPWYNEMEDPYNNWAQLPAWQAILDGRMQHAILEKVKYLLDLTTGIDM